MQTTTLVSGKPEQTVAQYSEQQKRLLFVNEVRNRIRGLEYLIDCDCFGPAADACVLARESIVAEQSRRQQERERQLELDGLAMRSGPDAQYFSSMDEYRAAEGYSSPVS